MLPLCSLADSAMNDKTAWKGVTYNFVMGVHPHNAKDYTDEVEATILEAMKHVGGSWRLRLECMG